jgi:excisionase family DNA binding protein
MQRSSANTARMVDTQIVVMTTKEAADYLQVPLSTIYRLLRKGKVPAVKIGADWRFVKSRIDAWKADLTKSI